ncbi:MULTISPECIES: oligosaccharide flippase family protein [Bacteroides]|uniref:Polysaccharide biosynthesis protein C-terminal domain-containing protein n=1 Tax=Bacteroides nordii CL02T12C05 TaxID=997884 RepID=I8X8W0_9BACE|nr:oligosaccharide flippase family protein [Bacteroides nordii]EIY46537.1 hypothetical protein HMPREF1068_03305 [Bacteroides nordii CL02T12C05]MCG4769686.1 oligosaccharide flippase family protein [Bacteroides nordii]
MAVNQLKAGALLSYVSIALNMVIGLLYTPYMLRMLGQSEYGLYSLAASLIAYLTVLDLGFGNAIVRYTAKFRAEGKTNEQEEMFGMFFLLYIGIGLIALIIGLILFLNVGNLFSAKMSAYEVSRMRIMLGLMTFNMAFTFPMSIWGSIMTAYERFVFQRIVSIIRSVMNPIVMVALLVIGYKAVVMVIVTTIFNVVTLFINWWYCKHRLNIKVRFARFKWEFLREVSIYSFWIFLNVIMDRIYWSTGQFILGMYRGTESVAVYSVAIQLKDMFYMFSTAISGVFLPKVTALVCKGVSDKEVSDLFIRTGRIQYILMSFVLTGFILLGRSFVNLWAGPDYNQSYIIALLFFIPTLVPLIQNLGITILMARNQLRFRSLLILIISVASLFLAVPLAYRFGAIGCAIATSIAIIIGHGIILNIYYDKEIRLDILLFWKEIIKMSFVPLIIIIIGGIVLRFIAVNTFTSFVVAGLALTVIFVPSFYFISMNKSERELFTKPIIQLVKRIR